ncbi:MAG: serine--tRNA ligase [Alphaproteobacteria bacterium]
MHDIRWIRDNAQAFDAALARRNLAPMAQKLLATDEALRGIKTDLQNMQAERNARSKEIGAAKSRGEDAQDIIEHVAQLKSAIQDGEEKERALDANLRDLLAGIPNLLDADVPDGADEESNVELRRVGEPATFDFDPKDHIDLGESLGLMDFEAAARMSGSRFVVLKGALARLERALGAFMIDVQTGENGYEEVSPPLLVRDEAVFGTNQLPKFAEDLFKTTNDYWLIPTAEVSLTNIVREQILDDETLPRRYTALTPCFRSEAGAAGKDTRGMIRMHQFTKVELVSVVRPQDSTAEHERMTGCAEQILQRLGLAYRVMVLASGDTGFGARKTYDLEVWLPGQVQYREISSCSNTGDFQARRMNARFRPEGEKGTRFVHTLNGSGVAVGRALVAVLENYQQADGSIAIPEALQPYMGGQTVIQPDGTGA